MPTISWFYGIAIRMYFLDHPPPHFQAVYGEHEANVREGKISVNSPIARALIGKSKGETTEVTTPRGARSYEILKVEYK